MKIVSPHQKSVGTKTKMLEHPRSSPPIANCLTRSKLTSYNINTITAIQFD